MNEGTSRWNYLSHTLIAAMLLFSSTCLPAQTAKPAPPQPHVRELPKPTNLQVLPKDISSKDLLATMNHFRQDLGVHCSFCHVQDSQTHHMDFASDAKPEKSSARVMMRMTHEIDSKYLDQLPDQGGMMQVSCGTCHRGQSTPSEFVPPPEEHKPPSPKKM
jgi:hypothetical protein